jgi:enoyl-CoA hydratase/carnithine racemase
MTDADRDPLIVEHEPPIGWLVLNRPEVRNALNMRTWARIAEGVAELDADPAIYVLVMRGATDAAFISGADISEFPSLRNDAAQARVYRDAPGRAIAALSNSPKPTIAMIAGLCIGGGVQVALSCDLRIAAQGAKMGIPAARLGLAYPFEAIESLVNTVGHANAREILFSARLFDAQEALSMGLVNRVVEPSRLKTFTIDYASKIAANAPLTLRSAKRAIGEALKDAAARDRKMLEQAAAACFDSEDYKEGVRAFLEKRSPKFSGK